MRVKCISHKGMHTEVGRKAFPLGVEVHAFVNSNDALYILGIDGQSYLCTEIRNNFKEVKENKMGEVFSDVKAYVKDNKNVIYTIALVVLLDHFFLEGKLRSKVQDLLDTMLNKAKKQIGGTDGQAQ